MMPYNLLIELYHRCQPSYRKLNAALSRANKPLQVGYDL